MNSYFTLRNQLRFERMTQISPTRTPLLAQLSHLDNRRECTVMFSSKLTC